MIHQIKTKAEIQRVAQLAKEIWTEHFLPIIGQKQVDYMLNKFQSPEAIKTQIQKESYHYFFINDGSNNIGYFAIQKQNRILFLSKLYVNRENRGRGFGKAALAYIIEFAKEHTLNKIQLTVNKDNTNSIKAYKKMGFVVTGKQVIDIGNNFVMDDYKMEFGVL